MLRITTTNTTDRSRVLLKLEGKLLEPWIEELQRSINGSSGHPSTLNLDLSGLTFADAAGTKILTDLLRAEGARLSACSGYLAALLHVEKS